MIFSLKRKRTMTSALFDGIIKHYARIVVSARVIGMANDLSNTDFLVV